MGYELHELKVDGKTVGYVPFQNTADVWSEDLYADRDAFKAGRRLGELHCSQPPYSANRHDPHPLVMADLFDGWADAPLPCLYCPACKATVSPPYDGYVYLDYPKEWLAFVRPVAAMYKEER